MEALKWQREIFDELDFQKKKIEINKRTEWEWRELYIRRFLLISLNTLILLCVIAGAVLIKYYEV